MNCPECQFENPEGAKFCNECGNKLEFACPECGKVNALGSRFCNECGYDLRKLTESLPIDYNKPQSYTPKHLADKIITTRSAIEGERKFVTVLFADVADYTSIAEKLDPEDVHQIMDGCFRILLDEIHKYEGTVNQFTGDGVMALFGAPVAHEDHAQRACHSALSIKGTLKKYSEGLAERFGIDFKMRVGLNSGPVVVGAIGDDLRMDYTAIGDTTNLAARMEKTAAPGTTRVTGYTHKLAMDFFKFEPLGKVQVKGKKEYQEAYELIGVSDVETRIEAAAAKGLTKFVGRSREMQAIKEAYEKAQSGSGQVVGVVGEAGVGKSRLLIELRKILPVGEYTYIEARCLPYGGAMPYLPILDILRAYFDIKEGEHEANIKKKVEEKIIRLDKRLEQIRSPFQELLSLEVEDGAYLQLDPGVKRLKTFEAIRDVLVWESENKPLIVAVEDLHWIDKNSEEFLSYLIDWLANTHILLILLYRPEYTHQWGSKSYYSKIGVNQLSTSTGAELVQAILEAGEVVEELKGLLLGRAAGNPLFLEELTFSLLENGSIERKDHQYVLTRKASEIQVPDTIQGIIAARIDRVEAALKRIMQVASVIGREFAFRILQMIMGMKEELKSHLLNLQGLEFISEKRLFPELEYIFKHALTQEVAYNSLLHKRRKEIHERIGEAIEALYTDRLEEYYELLAYHYERSEKIEKAVVYLDLANQKAVRILAMAEAATYFDKAMKLLDTLPDNDLNRKRRVSLLVNQDVVFFLALKLSEYYDLLIHHEPLAVGLGDKELLGGFYVCMGHYEWALGYFDKAIMTLTKAAELCEAAGNAEDAGNAYMWLEWSYWFKGDYERVLAYKEQVVRVMEHRFNLRWYVWALCVASMAYSFMGRWDDALEEGRHALREAEKYSDSSLISFANWTLSAAYVWKKDLDRSVQHAELAFREAPTIADKAMAQMPLAYARCLAGEPHQGVEVLASIISMFQNVHFAAAEICWSFGLGEGYLLAGDNRKATQTLADNLERAEQSGMKFHIGWAHRLLGELAIKTDPSKSAHHFEKSIAVLREVKAENELALAYADYGRFHKRQGDMSQARKYFTNALEIFERLGTLIEPDKIRKELADLPEGT